jgi:RNA polymerase sigma-70 factor (ECF subfamily)
VVYLLFNEGFHSSEVGRAMNLELCHEAIHLTTLLMAEPRVVNRDTLGLLSLMRFHLARAASRLDDDGFNVPIDRQDRTRWDVESIATGRALLKFARGVVPGASDRFYIEATIAEQHCVASRFEATDWDAIVLAYDALVLATGSPVAALNRAVALGHVGRLAEAVAQVMQTAEHPVLRDSHQPPAVLAYLAALAGDGVEARRQAARANRLGGTPHEQRALGEQVERLLARAPSVTSG